jgi:hypothetical protein
MRCFLTVVKVTQGTQEELEQGGLELDPVAAGENYETCLLFLMPEGKEANRVSFLPYDPETPTDHVYWDVA